VYSITFYRTESGNIPVYDYIKKLASSSGKDNRINLQKIQDYINILKNYGTRAGMPYVEHLDGEIWELRPLRNRILFAGWIDGGFVLLHHFLKKTRKTPKREIEQTKRELADFKERSK